MTTGWALKRIVRVTSTRGNTKDFTYEGPTGASRAMVNEFLLTIAPGWIEVRDETEVYGENERGKCTVTVSYAVTASGEMQDPDSPDYGLVARTWEKDTTQSQESLLSHPNVAPLYTVDLNWPGNIRRAGIAYTKRLEKYVSDTTGTLEMPDPAEMLTKVEPATVASLPNVLALRDTATWLFAEYAADSNATFDYDYPVLVKTELVTSTTVLHASNTNVNHIYTYEGMKHYEGDPEVNTLIAASELSGWYWLKKSPDTPRASQGRWNIVQHFQGIEAMNPFLIKRHGAAIDAPA